MYVYYDPILPSVTYDIQRQKVLDADAVAPLRDALLVLVEAAPRILPSYEVATSASARAQLEELGAEVRTGTRVTDIDARGVTLEGSRVQARTVLWGAGVAASPLGAKLGVPLDRVGRVRVLSDLSVPGAPEVSVIGDLE